MGDESTMRALVNRAGDVGAIALGVVAPELVPALTAMEDKLRPAEDMLAADLAQRVRKWTGKNNASGNQK